jgi:hypothetical protein
MAITCRSGLDQTSRTLPGKKNLLQHHTTRTYVTDECIALRNHLLETRVYDLSKKRLLILSKSTSSLLPSSRSFFLIEFVHSCLW